jgi:hypothetical protein
MLTLQTSIMIAVGWSAIYWQWTSTQMAVIIGGMIAYFVTVLFVAKGKVWVRCAVRARLES